MIDRVLPAEREPKAWTGKSVSEQVRRYEYIDALRGYAILGVVSVHSSQLTTPHNDFLRSMMTLGSRGVQLFFVASALTLCMSWHFRSQRECHPMRNFYYRRFFRIAPMYYLAIVLYMSLYGFSERYWAPSGIDWWYLPLTILFLNGYHPETITSVVPGGWSVVVEMSFYLVLPFLLSRMKTVFSSIALLVVSLLLSVTATMVFQLVYSGRYAVEQQYLVSSFTSLNFFGQCPVFAVGVLAYFVLDRFGSLRRAIVYADVIAIFLLALVVHSTSFSMMRLLSNHVVIAALFSLFALTLASYPMKIFVNGGIALLGRISFSMYLLHFAVLEMLKRGGLGGAAAKGDVASVLNLICVVTVTVPLSYLTYSVIERPGIRLGSFVIDRIEQRGLLRRSFR